MTIKFNRKSLLTLHSNYLKYYDKKKLLTIYISICVLIQSIKKCSNIFQQKEFKKKLKQIFMYKI